MVLTDTPRQAETPGTAVSPDSAEVEAHLRGIVKQHPAIASLRDLGRSAQGRPLLAIDIHDPHVPDTQKQHALIVAGQHGNEESSRMVALALIDHLVSPKAANIRAKQRVVVFPNANPDGCEADSYHNADGLLINMDHTPDGPQTSEGTAIASLMNALKPDLYIDCHSCGHTGFGSDMVLYPVTRSYTEDDNLVHRMAHEMCEAGEAAGLPQITHSLTWWATGDPETETSSTLHAYQQFKSIVMLTENCEDNTGSYPAPLRTRTGLAKLLTAIAYGQRRDPSCAYPGYPNQRVIGMKNLSVVAVGDTAADRRASRVSIWRQADHFARLKHTLPEPEFHKQINLDYRGPELGPVGVQARVTGLLEVESVAIDGRTLRPATRDGYFSFQDTCSTHVVVALPKLTRGRYQIDITLR